MPDTEQTAAEIAADSIRDKVSRDPSLLDVLQRRFGVVDLGLDRIGDRPDVEQIDAALEPAIDTKDYDVDDLDGLDGPGLRSLAKAEGLALANPRAAAAKLREEIRADRAEQEGLRRDFAVTADIVPDFAKLNAAQLRAYAKVHEIPLENDPSVEGELRMQIEAALELRKAAASAKA